MRVEHAGYKLDVQPASALEVNRIRFASLRIARAAEEHTRERIEQVMALPPAEADEAIAKLEEEAVRTIQLERRRAELVAEFVVSAVDPEGVLLEREGIVRMLQGVEGMIFAALGEVAPAPTEAELGESEGLPGT